MTVSDSVCHHRLACVDQQLSWVLENPAMSEWLKSALKSALDEDPISLVNDLEILTHLLGMRAKALAQNAFERPVHPGPDL